VGFMAVTCFPYIAVQRMVVLAISLHLTWIWPKSYTYLPQIFQMTKVCIMAVMVQQTQQCIWTLYTLGCYSYRHKGG